VGKGKKHTNETTNVSTRKENNNAWMKQHGIGYSFILNDSLY
jgi:hypothetical protein